MDIGITGYKGFLAKHLIEHISSIGIKITPIDCDVRNFSELSGKFDAIVHLSADIGGSLYTSENQFKPTLNNLQMDSNIIRYCSENDIKLLFPSSACIYPVDTDKKLNEDVIWDKANPFKMYGLERLLMTRLAKYADFDFRVVILHTIYGESKNSTNFPVEICKKFLSDDEIVVWGDGSQTRTFLHVNDAVDMMVEVLFGEYYGVVNVSESEVVTIKEVVDILSEYTGRTDIKFDLTKPVGAKNRGADMTLYNKNYNYTPVVKIKDGIIKLYEYLKNEKN